MEWGSESGDVLKSSGDGAVQWSSVQARGMVQLLQGVIVRDVEVSFFRSSEQQWHDEVLLGGVLGDVACEELVGQGQSPRKMACSQRQKLRPACDVVATTSMRHERMTAVNLCNMLLYLL